MLDRKSDNVWLRMLAYAHYLSQFSVEFLIYTRSYKQYGDAYTSCSKGTCAAAAAMLKMIMAARLFRQSIYWSQFSIEFLIYASKNNTTLYLINFQLEKYRRNVKILSVFLDRLRRWKETSILVKSLYHARCLLESPNL